MATADSLSAEDKEFLAQCEEELKDRFTEKDENYMRVFNAEPSMPPIMPSWWVPNSGRRNDRRNNRRSHPYDRNDRYGNRDQYDRRDNQERSDYRGRRGYSDCSDRRGYSDYGDRSHGYRQQRPRY